MRSWSKAEPRDVSPVTLCRRLQWPVVPLQPQPGAAGTSARRSGGTFGGLHPPQAMGSKVLSGAGRVVGQQQMVPVRSVIRFCYKFAAFSDSNVFRSCGCACGRRGVVKSAPDQSISCQNGYIKQID